MKTSVYFVVVVDADPSRSRLGDNNDRVMEKYLITRSLMKGLVDGKAAVCVHTSPRHRDRFFHDPFMEYWKSWVRQGGELILHPEEDVYSTPESKVNGDSYYNHPEHMASVIRAKVSEMKKHRLSLTAFRGALFGLTDDLVPVLKQAGFRIDMSCASGIVLPERMADWTGAPSNAYYMSTGSYLKPSGRPGKNALFEIPLGWDGKGTDLSCNYLFHERSTYRKLCRVWDKIVIRGEKEARPQFVNFLCHTYSMQNTKLRTQCEKILNYMIRHQGIPATASEAKSLYDKYLVDKKTAGRR